MFASSNLKSMETRIFNRFLKFNRFERHSRTLEKWRNLGPKKALWYMAFAAESTLDGISNLSSTI